MTAQDRRVSKQINDLRKAAGHYDRVPDVRKIG